MTVDIVTSLLVIAGWIYLAWSLRNLRGVK